MADRRLDIDGAAHLLLAPQVGLLHPEEQVLEAMLAGWATQQRSRLLAPATIQPRVKTVRRFLRFTGTYPWQWTAADIEEWTSSLLSSSRPKAHSTLRSYQLAVAAFLDYLTDARYGWAVECETRFGTHPVQICHEHNLATHANGYEGRPGNRPLSRQELQDLFDHADAQVDRARRLGRKGLAAGVATRRCSRSAMPLGCAAARSPCWRWSTSPPTRPRRSLAATGC